MSAITFFAQGSDYIAIDFLGRSAMTTNTCLVAAGLFAATFVSSSASADWSSNYPWCLMTDSSQECAFTSMAQCLASKHGNADFCEPNNTYIGNTRSFGSRAW